MVELSGLARKATRGTIFVFITSYSLTAINFIGGIILARLLLPDDFGLMSLAVVYVTAFSVVKDLGLEGALLYQREDEDQVVSTFFWIQLLAAFLSIIFAFATIFIVPAAYPADLKYVLGVLAVFVLIEALGVVPRTILEKRFAFKNISLIEVGGALVALIVAMIAAQQGWGVWALVLYRIVPILMKTVGFWLIGGFRPLWVFRQDVLQWFFKSFGFPVFLSSLATMVLFQYDNFLIGTFIGTAALGYYTRAYSLARLPTQLITQVISRVAFPVYSSCQDDIQKLSKAFGIFLKGIWRLALPLTLLMFVLANEIIVILLGEKWLPSVPYLQILAGYSIARILLDDTGPLFSGGFGAPKITTRIFIIQTLLFLPLGYVAMRTFDVVGVAISVNLIMMVGIILAYGEIKRRLNLSYWEIFGLPTIAGVLSLGVLYSVIPYLSFDFLWLQVAAKGSVLGGSYLSLLLFLERKTLIVEVQKMFKYMRNS